METENNSVIESGQLENCKQELERWKELYLRLQADMENMKRRLHKEQELQINRAMQDLFSDLLPIVDNFDRALLASSDYPADWSPPVRRSSACPPELAERRWESEGGLVQGLILIRKEFAHVLERYGVREMTEVKIFDPELHEALSQIPADGTVEAGAIVTVLEKGYWYKDQVLRHAKVTVAS
jgi:molecular chaperone GrpE